MKSCKSLFFLFTATIIWGLSYVVQCNTGSLGPFSFLACRSFLAVLSLLPVIFLTERRPLFDSCGKATLVCGSVTGSILFVALLLQQLGINIGSNAGKAGFITGLYTVFVPVFSFLFWRKKTAAHIWIGVLFALIGLFLLTVTPDASGIELGDLCLFIGAVFWAFRTLSIDRFIDKVYPLRFSAIQFLVCGIWSLLFSLILEHPTSVQISSAWFAILFCGILGSGVGHTFQVLGQRNFDPTLCSIILSTESLFGAVAGAVFLQERMGTQGIIGAALMFVGIMISQFKSKTSA